jgi:glucose/arabinose dehydrogenase
VTSAVRSRLIRVRFDPANPRQVAETEELLHGVYGRLRDVVSGPDGALYVATSNRDGRGRPRPGDDRILRLVETPRVH